MIKPLNPLSKEVRVKTTISAILPLIFLGFFSSAAMAQNQPRVGRDAAAKYFQKGNSDDSGSGSQVAGVSDHYLAISFGRYVSSQSYDWGKDGQQNGVGGNGLDVTYRVGEWYKSMDLNLRIGYNEYDVGGEDASKLSFMPMITFPDASSRFPLYFGAGAGLGVFLKQAHDKSPLSFDYQLVVGARFFDIYENTGFFIEAGLKNHLLLTSSGQLNGTFLAGGLVFTF
ncbi:MAG TPA: hypothetical protein VF412_11905 [Bdellovibrio sp.]|uniref:hypothetical protein n=1 Tax=Bdellovibrio sp. TaxID=28201 RepID=UPI002F09F95E